MKTCPNLTYFVNINFFYNIFRIISNYLILECVTWLKIPLPSHQTHSQMEGDCKNLNSSKLEGPKT